MSAQWLQAVKQIVACDTEEAKVRGRVHYDSYGNAHPMNPRSAAEKPRVDTRDSLT